MRDFEYFRSLYPEEAKRLAWFVEEVLDEMDFDDSPIFDDYPERILLEQLIRRAAERAGIEQMKAMELEETEAAVHVSYGPLNGRYREWEPETVRIQETQMRRPWDPPPGPGMPPRPPQGPWNPPPSRSPNHQWDLLSVILMHALQQRRCRDGRCR